MSVHHILQIETATQVCSVAVSANGITSAYKEINEPNIHASRLTMLISELLQELALGFADLSAVAVSKGPGSYTGLRIGVSTAKGLCYATDLPLIGVNTLSSMAEGFKESYPDSQEDYGRLCPMLDARRMEVYMAMYDHALRPLSPVSAVIVDAQSFNEMPGEGRMALFGTGADKCRELFEGNPQVHVVPGFLNSARFLSRQAYQAYLEGDFVDVAYFEPYYLKDFVATVPKNTP